MSETLVNASVLYLFGTWAGSILFHSAVVAPSVFGQLPEGHAGPFLRHLFPRFFRFGLVCGAIALAVLIAFASTGGAAPVKALLITGAMLALQGGALLMVPAINRARDEGESARTRFGRLHGINVLMTLAVLVLTIVGLVLAATGQLLT